jgi:hypothetical protein
MTAALIRTLLFVHRWLGVAVAGLVTMWFMSGIVMIYRGYPSIEREDHLRRAALLDPSTIARLPHQIFGDAGLESPPTLTLMTVDGRPAYVGGATVVFADDGSPLERVDAAMIDRAAGAWVDRPTHAARRREVVDDDVWTVGNLRGVRPLFKYEWPDGEEVYVDGEAVVVQHTTRATRAWAWLGAIPHWFYVPVLRTQDRIWVGALIFTSALTVMTALLGLTAAAWLVAPRRRYRRGGVPVSLPAAGWRRWHTLLGLSVGIIVLTWTFSGLMSLQPAGLTQWFDRYVRPEAGAGGGGPDAEAVAALSVVLTDRPVAFARYTTKTPGDVLAAAPEFGARTLEYVSLAGEPAYLLTNGSGEGRLVSATAAPLPSFQPDAVAARLQTGMGSRASVSVLPTYDAYYRDRTGRLPLPVVAVRIHDAGRSRHYVDPATASVVAIHSDDDWVYRWLHLAPHTFDLPWLVNHGALREAVMVLLLLCGAALSATSLVLAGRVLTRRLRRLGVALGGGSG